jgi:lysophospholipase L1-like esterase
MRNAITYTNALRELTEAGDMIFVNCVHALSCLPKRQVLQNDGFHLSLVGHNVVGRAIAQSIVADVSKRS